jgi:hypothetical protein
MSLILSGTDGLSDVDGSAATPAIRGTDANTGIFFPAADTIGFSEGGAEVARFDSSGNFGLGVTPSANAGVSTLNIANYNRTFSALTMGSNANSAGYVGYNMGNTSTSNTWKYISADTGSALYFAGNEMRFMQFASGSAGATTSGTQAMTLDASGNFGIGTTSPQATIVAAGSNATVYKAMILRNGNGSDGSSATIDFETSAGTQGSEAAMAGRIAGLRTSSGTSGALTFSTTNAGVLGERARIDSSGNLLVGTTDSSDSTGVGIKIRPTSTTSAISCTANTNGGLSTYHFYNTNATNNGYRFYVNVNGGISNYQANNVNLSDRREKTNFAPAKSYLDTICAIPVQTFNYIDQNMEDDLGLTLGVVAQDVQAVAPELVSESNWGTEEDPKMRLSIYQTDLQYALMKCIQEQQALITTLTARITALESA